MKHLLWALLAVDCLLSGKLGIAAPIVREMPQTQAQGLTGAGASLTVWAGSGTNIDFTRTGETIQRAWLDDPSLLTLDFDGSLCNHSAGNDCSGASIIHLRRITEIRFPNLPATNATLLTVVTQSDHSKKLYLFNVSYGSGPPAYATVAITPHFQLGNGVVLRGDRASEWNTVEAGLTQAIQQHLILPDSPVTLRVRDFLLRVRSGTPVQQAIRDAKVTMVVISRLATLGNASHPVSQTQF